MPQLSSLVLKNGAGTDVSFIPASGVEKGVATLTHGTGVPIGDERITASLVRTASGRVKVSIRIALPELATEAVGAQNKYSILRTAYVDCTFNYDGSSTFDERFDARTFLMNALNSQMLGKMVVDLEPLY